MRNVRKNGMKIAGNFEMFLKAIVKVFKDIGNSLKFLCVRGIYIQLKVCEIFFLKSFLHKLFPDIRLCDQGPSSPSLVVVI